MRAIRIVFTIVGIFIIFFCAIDSHGKRSNVVDQDRHFVKFGNGIVRDTQSRLEWYAGPDQGTSWEQALNWVSALEVDGGGWHMPSRIELDSLYHIGDGVNNITYLLDNSGYWIWAGQTENESSKWVFSFSFGGEGWNGQPPADGGRAIAVRIH